MAEPAARRSGSALAVGLAVLATGFAGLVVTGSVGPLAAPAAAAASCMAPGAVIAPIPWAQRTLAPERVWPLATGAGVTIAVLDSGVDAAHPQLAGRVLPGADFLDEKGKRRDTDCVGHGTAVASVMVAQRGNGTGLRGIAPGAMVLPITISEREGIDDSAGGKAATPHDFADAIRWAVTQGAKVINFSVTMYTDSPEVREAVRFAVASNVVVVAAVGNLGRDKNPTPYPAAYDDVLGVGAVDESGQVLPESAHGSYVDIVAPGDAIVGATPVRGHASWRGTSFAAPFVSATAALVRQHWPKLSAREVVRRILATASPSPGGARSPFYGRGVVDPYRAVAEDLVAPAPAATATPVRATPDLAALAREQRLREQSRTALLVAAIGTALTVAFAGGLVVAARGRRRRWRPTRARPPDPPEERADVPAVLFADFP